MPTTNESLRDALLRHHIGLQRYAAGEVRQIIAILDATDADLADELRRRLQAIADGRRVSPLVLERLEKLIASIKAMRLAAYREVGKRLTSDLEELGTYEVGFVANAIVAAVPIKLELATTSVIKQVGDIVRSKPFRGALLKDWIADLAAQEIKTLRREINIGMAEGEGIDQIVRRIMGSGKSGTTGVVGISRRHLTTLVRTAVSHVANESRDRLYEANTDLVKGIQWLSTLDGRTTDLCISRDGHSYRVGTHEPLDGGPPWRAGPGRLHYQCRSTSTPVLATWRQLGIDLGEAPEGTRASMNGQVPESVTYTDWLQRQSAEFQDHVLGRKRARLMRSGELTWDRIFTPNGEFRTLRELVESDAR